MLKQILLSVSKDFLFKVQNESTKIYINTKIKLQEIKFKIEWNEDTYKECIICL